MTLQELTPAAPAAPVVTGVQPLARSVTWRSALVLSIGAALLVTVSLGPMAAELGNASALVWSATAIVGALQCMLIARIAARYADRAGGTATYAHAALHRTSPVLGAVSSWAYWFAWTPGIAVNALFAGTYVSAALGIEATLPLAVAFVVLLYVGNYFGLKMNMWLYTVIGMVAVIPLVAIVAAVLIEPGKLQWPNVWPLAVPDHGWGSWVTWSLIMKWAFVAVWSSYGAEIASTVIAEMKDRETRINRAMAAAAAAGVVSFTVIPIILIALSGVAGVQEDPQAVFLAPAQELFGTWGANVVVLMLAAGLLLGAQAFVVSSSRTIYQMTADGHLPRIFGRTNRFGVPVGSITWDAVVILSLLAIFQGSIVDVVASANIGYVVVFILLPITYLVLRRRLQGSWFSGALAVALGAFNLVLLVWGGVQWGWKVVLTGAVVLFIIVPLSILVRRRSHDTA